MHRSIRFCFAALLVFAGCSSRTEFGAPAPEAETPPAPATGTNAVGTTAMQEEADGFLLDYSIRYRELHTAAQRAEWISNTHIVEGDDTNAARTRAAQEAKAAFVGSKENIAAVRKYLAGKQALRPLQVKQLERILFLAAEYPMTIEDSVKARIAAETKQSELLYGFKYKLDGKEISTNDIDDMLRTEHDLKKRLAVWEASKEVGPTLRAGLIELRSRRNEIVRQFGYKDFFSYMASEYGMTTEELAKTVDQINRDLRPLFRELHTYFRHELAARYGQPVPDLIPAHWLPNRWGQDWAALVDVPGYDLDAALAGKPAQWLIEQAERFYVSLGFEPLPLEFWKGSSLYPVPPDALYKKNNHASAWHMDLDREVVSLMSVEPNADWYETTHHELGHIYYYLCYSRPEVPIVLRAGADRAYHEAIGSLMGLAAMQPRFIKTVGLEVSGEAVDPMQLLLREALNHVVFIPWSTGTMFNFEKELYFDELAPERWNARWWELAAKYQGIAPPSPRDEHWCDPATKTHINDDPAGYYDYALSSVLLFQLHDTIAKKILKEPVRDTNYYGRREVGDFLRSILSPGATVDARALLREKTGSDLSARAMLEYFAPLQAWLAEKNRGRKHTLPEL